MSVKLLIDMNLSPGWVDYFAAEGFSAVHWSAVGDPLADDDILMRWASEHGYVVFTHDLDFGTALSLTHLAGPSVIQVRTQTVLPEDIAPLVLSVLRQHATALAAGALIVVEEKAARVRILPLTHTD